MIKLTLEADENRESICHCCGRMSINGHGFIYDNGTPYGVYYVSWSPLHHIRSITLAIALGQWEDFSTPEQRVCMGIEIYGDEVQTLFRFIEPAESPWSETTLLGRMISRSEALSHTLKNTMFAVAETIAAQHPGVRDFLTTTRARQS